MLLPSPSSSSVSQWSRTRSAATGSSSAQASRTAVSSEVAKEAVKGCSEPTGAPSSSGTVTSRSDSRWVSRSRAPAKLGPERAAPETSTRPACAARPVARALTVSTRR